MKGLVYSVIAGCLMGFFYPLLMKPISPNFNSAPIAPGMLTPYVALVAFGVPWLAAAAAITLRAALAWLPALALGGASLWLHRRRPALATA